MVVRWTKPAANDLTHISDYTEEHFGQNKPAAQAWQFTRRRTR